MADLKTYVLLDAMNSTAPIFQQVSKTQRVQMNKLRQWDTYKQLTFTDEKGENKTARLKLNANTIWQDEQVKDLNIPANEKFTDRERLATRFVYGTLMTNNLVVQKFLEAIPQFDGFKGERDDIPAAYTTYDKKTETKAANEDFRKRLKAATKIVELDLKGGEELLLAVYGSSYELPKGDKESRLNDVQNALVRFLDEDGEAAVEEILKDRTGNVDDALAILIGKAVNMGILSFETVVGQVAHKRLDKWEPVKEISSDYDIPTRQRYFSEWLSSPDGALEKGDIEKEIAAIEAEDKKKGQK